MKTIQIFFSTIEAKIFETIKKIPAPQGKVYVCSFWLFYCDYENIYAPCFAYNTVGGSKEDKWVPPEWLVSEEMRMMDTLEPIYDEIMEFMKGKNDEAWEKLIADQWDFYCGMCMKINTNEKLKSALFGHWNISDDFVCGIFEKREGEDIYNDLVMKSLGKDVATKLQVDIGY